MSPPSALVSYSSMQVGNEMEYRTGWSATSVMFSHGFPFFSAPRSVRLGDGRVGLLLLFSQQGRLDTTAWL